MKRASTVLWAFLLLLAQGRAFGFVDQIAFSPTNPHAGQPITISFRSGVCDGVDTPVVWELQGSGSVRDLVVNGVAFQEPLFCNSAIGTTAIVIGTLPPGAYEIHIKIRDPNDGLGGILSPSFGSAQFVVGPTLAIPGLGRLGQALIVALILALTVWLRNGRFGAPLLMIVVFGYGLASPPVRAQDAFIVELTLAPPPAPPPEAIVEGYDFATGLNPPFPALTVGSPSYAVYLLPFRASGAFSALLQANPGSVRAQLERSLLVAYASAEDRAAGMQAMQAEGAVESVSLPIDLDFAAAPATGLPRPAALGGIPDWRTQLRLPQAWARVGGWARVGVLDNGYDTGHPDLLAFDGAGQLTGGNTITADTLDLGRLGFNQTVADCSFPAPSTCDTNLDEMEPVAIPAGAATGTACDVTVDDPIADRLMRPWFAGHGTHVLGLVGASHANADASQGVCPHCGVQPMRIGFERCQAGRVTVSSSGTAAAAAITYLTDRGVQVLNMSVANNLPGVATFFCQQNPSNSQCRAFEFARVNGVVLVAASGNDRTRIGFPARDPRLVAAGGVDENLAFWNQDPDPPPNHLDGCPSPGNTSECGSNWTTITGDPKQEVVVPARQIDSTFYRGQNWNVAVDCGDGVLGVMSDGHGPCTGTSMSAPIVSGVVGLMLSVNPLLLPGDPVGSVFEPIGVRDLLATSTDRSQLGLDWDAKLGYGLVDADAAVQAVLGRVAGQVVKNRATPIFEMWGGSATDFAYSATPQGAVALILNGNGGYLSSGGSVPGYFDFPHDPLLVSFLNPGALFFVLSTENKPDPTNPPLIPLFLLERIRPWPLGCVGGAGCNSNNRDVTLASSAADVAAMVADGYRYFHRQGFIYAPCAQEPACIPVGAERLYRQCNPAEDDCAVFLEFNRAGMESQGYTEALPAGSPTLLGYAYRNIDSDFDLLADAMEFVIGTNPQRADSDGDGQIDGLEFPQAGAPKSDPCQGPNVQCDPSSLFANGFE